MDWDAANLTSLVNEVRRLRRVVERSDVEDDEQLLSLLRDVEDALVDARESRSADREGTS